jgi:UDP-N-acetylglucosamine 3-dehydrogenase
MGRFHARRWAQLPVTIAGFYDTSGSAAAQAAQELSCRPFEDLQALVNAVDVVDVCCPTPDHRVPVLTAAAAGKDVVCEKPLARHLVDALEILATCRENGVRLFVAHVVRFFPQFARAKALLDAGKLGRPGMIRSVRGGQPPDPERRSWFADFSHSGGVILDVSIHDLDFARWCFGDVERVFARGLTFAGVAPYDHTLITLRFKNGALGHVEGSWAFPRGEPFRTRFEITGDAGLMEWDSLTSAPVQVVLRSEEAPNAAAVPVTYDPLAPADDPYFIELQHFLDCLDTGEPFRVSPEDGLEALRLSLAAVESIASGRPVTLDAFNG